MSDEDQAELDAARADRFTWHDNDLIVTKWGPNGRPIRAVQVKRRAGRELLGTFELKQGRVTFSGSFEGATELMTKGVENEDGITLGPDDGEEFLRELLPLNGVLDADVIYDPITADEPN